MVRFSSDSRFFSPTPVTNTTRVASRAYVMRRFRKGLSINAVRSPDNIRIENAILEPTSDLSNKFLRELETKPRKYSIDHLTGSYDLHVPSAQ